jgi:4-amino-4-deoxy-L-arabinose transferase-like glycosyltransferase
MKKNNPIYFLLFILLIMGAFASMAQNNYGLKLIGGVAFVFALVFIVEFISVVRTKDKKDIFTLAEPVCLFILSFIFGLRVFYIQFSYIEWLFAAAAILLVLIYWKKMIRRYHHLQTKNNLLGKLVLVFHLCIILFLISLVMVPFAPKIAAVAGVAAFFLLFVFMAARFFKQYFLVDGENISSFSTVKNFKDHSIIIVSLFLLFSLYVGLNRIGMLPGIYSDEFPGAYSELVNKASSKKEKPINGKYKYEEFMEQYQQFLKRNSIKDK